jgi:hypothetical protein
LVEQILGRLEAVLGGLPRARGLFDLLVQLPAQLIVS